MSSGSHPVQLLLLGGLSRLSDLAGSKWFCPVVDQEVDQSEGAPAPIETRVLRKSERNPAVVDDYLVSPVSFDSIDFWG
jgi:hypothetical protein